MKAALRLLSLLKKPMTTTAENVAAGGTQASQVLDQVTGELVSKSELKRRIKEREKLAKKAEKEAAAPPGQKDKNLPKEEVLDPRLYFENRCAQVLKMENAYPHKVHKFNDVSFLSIYLSLHL